MSKRAKLRFEVKPAGNREWYWHCVHRNGDILFASETYKRKGAAARSMTRFIDAVSDGDYEIV